MCVTCSELPSSMSSMLLPRVVDLARFYPDLDSTFKKKLDPDPTLEKIRIGILYGFTKWNLNITFFFRHQSDWYSNTVLSLWSINTASKVKFLKIFERLMLRPDTCGIPPSILILFIIVNLYFYSFNLFTYILKKVFILISIQRCRQEPYFFGHTVCSRSVVHLFMVRILKKLYKIFGQTISPINIY